MLAKRASVTQGKGNPMSLKSSGIGLALLAAMAIAAIGAVNATAQVSGHFVSEAVGGHTMVSQVSSFPSNHGFIIKIDETSAFQCKEFSAFGTAVSGTLTEVEGTTQAKGCHTEGSEIETAIHTNECKGKAWSNATGALTGAMVCPAGKSLEITHPNCTILAPPQTTTGLTPTTIVKNNKHAITVDVNIQYTVHYEQGICIFLGTKHTATITGSTEVWGQDTTGAPVNITST